MIEIYFEGSQERGQAALLIAPPANAGSNQPAAGEATGELLPLTSDDAARLIAPLCSDPADDESWRFVEFVLNDADPRYQRPLQDFYHAWQDRNEQFFDQQLKVPHLTIAAGPPRALAFFKSLTDYGGRTQITIDARILTQRRRFVHQPYPAEGTRQFVHDLLLHEMVHQYLAEIKHCSDEENAKHQEAFAEVCNCIGSTMGLPRVFTRRRTRDDAGKPLANFWPVNVRPEGYYLGHVTPPGPSRPKRGPALRGIAGVLKLFRHLIDAGQPDTLTAIVQREADTDYEQDCTAKPSTEKGEATRIDAAWLTWNGGCIKQLLHAIHSRRMFDLMPMLADALSLAGCSDSSLLTHCRLPVVHTRNCWVLKALNG